KNNFLSISNNKDYYAEVILPKEVNPQEFIKNYQNNILEIRLNKAVSVIS
ncbi:MAG: hypothetical protein HYU63_09245, partial [Armatimonadetes bacterium]|nr:hypothetical protein [Armatimonadota bacterium]